MGPSPSTAARYGPVVSLSFRHRRLAPNKNIPHEKYWEIIADNLSKAAWSWGCISSADCDGRQFWVVAAEREDAGRFIVHADEKLTAFLELESAILRLRTIFLTNLRKFSQTRRVKRI
jgi:hypothetical protein